jgi:hypothetical protein
VSFLYFFLYWFSPQNLDNEKPDYIFAKFLIYILQYGWVVMSGAELIVGNQIKRFKIEKACCNVFSIQKPECK